MLRFLFCFFSFVFFTGCMSGNSIPQEAQSAHNALQKLRASTQTGVSLNNYEQLLIEAKTAVNLASSKLPPVPANADFGRDIVPGGMLTLLNKNLNEAMDEYQDAGAAWRIKMQNKNLIETPEGKAIQKKYEIADSDMDADKVTQYLWHQANLDTQAIERMIAQN